MPVADAFQRILIVERHRFSNLWQFRLKTSRFYGIMKNSRNDVIQMLCITSRKIIELSDGSFGIEGAAEPFDKLSVETMKNVLLQSL